MAISGGSDDRGAEPPLPEGVAEASGLQAGGGYLYRPSELLVTTDVADDVERQLRELTVGFRRTDQGLLPELGVERVEVDEHVPSLVTHLRGAGQLPATSVSPNHVMFPQARVRFYGVDAPAPPETEPDVKAQTSRLSDARVKVAVLDTGAIDHPYFAGRVQIDQGAEELADENGDGKLDLGAGHGTFVAGIILQEAPDATVEAVRIAHADGITDDLTVAQALDSLGDVQVVNLSLGCLTHDNTPPPAMAAAVQRLRQRDAAIVAAAGNAGATRATWPAGMKGVIAVGAIGTNGQPAPFTNRGWWVDACSPGEKVLSTFFLDWNGPLEHPDAPGPQHFKGWARWSGTSFAAPRVAGAIAMLTAGGMGPGEAAFRLVGAPGLPRVPDLGVHVPGRGGP